jgi:hypothetical protein
MEEFVVAIWVQYYNYIGVELRWPQLLHGLLGLLLLCRFESARSHLFGEELGCPQGCGRHDVEIPCVFRQIVAEASYLEEERDTLAVKHRPVADLIPGHVLLDRGSHFPDRVTDP